MTKLFWSRKRNKYKTLNFVCINFKLTGQLCAERQPFQIANYELAPCLAGAWNLHVQKSSETNKTSGTQGNVSSDGSTMWSDFVWGSEAQ